MGIIKSRYTRKGILAESDGTLFELLIFFSYFMTDRSALIAQVRASKGDLARPLKTSFTRWRFAAATIGFSGLFIPRILRLSAGNISHTLVEKRERERNVCRRQREAQSGRYPAERSTGPDPFLLTDGRGISSDIILFPSKKKPPSSRCRFSWGSNNRCCCCCCCLVPLACVFLCCDPASNPLCGVFVVGIHLDTITRPHRTPVRQKSFFSVANGAAKI